MSQVGTFLAYANGSVWTWVDGELYLPEHWFAPDMAELREKLGIPAERKFESQIELGGKTQTGTVFECAILISWIIITLSQCQGNIFITFDANLTLSF